jgi:hypothetical protein
MALIIGRILWIISYVYVSTGSVLASMLIEKCILKMSDAYY